MRSGLYYVRSEWKTPKWTASHTYDAYNFSSPGVPPEFDFSLTRPTPGTVEEQIIEYITDFTIDGHVCKYALKASFSKSSQKTVACLKFFGLLSGGTEEKIQTEKEHQRPCTVWVHLNKGDKKLHYLKRSWIPGHWISDSFDFNFTLPVLESSTVNESDSLSFMLWIEFERCNGSERNALKQLTDMLSRQTNCDVQFHLENNVRIGGHINVLTARSSVFAAMFQHKMKESQTGKVDILDVLPDIFKQLLHYIYSGRLEKPLTEETVRSLYVAADKYDIVDLKKECVGFLLNCIRVDSVTNLMAWSHLHSADELKDATLTFASLHGKEVCQLNDWENLTKNYPELCVVATRRMMENMSLSFAKSQTSTV